MSTITATEAYEAMLEHHKRLGEELASCADAVSGAVAAGRPYGPAVAGLVAYLAEEVLPHAAAEEKTIYPAAVRAGLAGTVGEMAAEHVTLLALGAEIATLADGGTVAGQARRIAGLFIAHAAKENDVLLPALLADKSADLAGLLAQMHDHTGHPQLPAPAAAGQPEDAQATVVSLLLQAAAALARAGEADRACKIAASAWAALHGTRPDLAVKVTAALHGLARRVGEGAGEPGLDAVLDVRDLAPARRHDAIFSAYQELKPGAGFVLVNDHDPKPLRYQFQAEHAGHFTWQDLQSGPEVWRVRIGHPATAPEDAGTDAEEPDLDVRPVSHGQRHGVIFTAYGALRPGAGFVLVNDHDPRPLRYQFEAQHAGEYTWDYLEAGPALWRVRIGRAEV
jgi:uncharacterized protein (DUF2249 family)